MTKIVLIAAFLIAAAHVAVIAGHLRSHTVAATSPKFDLRIINGFLIENVTSGVHVQGAPRALFVSPGVCLGKPFKKKSGNAQADRHAETQGRVT